MSRHSTCIVASSFPRHATDWAGRFVMESARVYEKLGPVDVLAPWDRETDPDYAPLGMRITRYSAINRRVPGMFYGEGGPENLARFHRLIQAPSGQLACTLAALRQVPNAARWVAHWMVPAGLAVAIARRPDQPALLVVHGGGWHVLKRTAAGLRLAKWIVSRMSHVICVASYQRKDILDLFHGHTRTIISDRISVCPMGLDVTRFAVERPQRPEGHKPVILAVGRLTPIKGFDRLLQASQKLDADVWIVGDGPERRNLERLGRRLNINLRLLGSVPHEQMETIYAGADIMAVPSRPIGSRVEGAPRVVLEAMAAGLAIVASDTGGISDLVRHSETGLLENGSEAGLRASLEWLVEDSRLRETLGRQAQALAWRFDWRALALDLLAPFA
jgi:glycosyltransferase involved in cell wall biosynthesis